jgi:hypothetical protein
MKRTANILAAGVASIALLGGIGAGIAYADPTPAPSSSSSSAEAPKKHPLLHAELFLQRGTVEKLSDESITLRSADGFVGTYLIGERTRVVVGAKGRRKPGTIDDVKTGDRVRLVALKDGDTLTARRIVDRGPR